MRVSAILVLLSSSAVLAAIPPNKVAVGMHIRGEGPNLVVPPLRRRRPGPEPDQMVDAPVLLNAGGDETTTTGKVITPPDTDPSTDTDTSGSSTPETDKSGLQGSPDDSVST